MISPAKALVAILILLGLLSPAAAEVLRLDYKGFAVGSTASGAAQ